MENAPILITGSHRSGTTWIGRMVSQSQSVTYLWEPFHVDHDPGLLNVRFAQENTYICARNEAAYLAAFENMLAFRYSLSARLSARPPTWVQRSRGVRAWTRFTRSRLIRRRPLLKDPRAVFSCEWLHQRFEVLPVISIRHPLDFAGSLKVKNWEFQFADLLNQPLLISDLLGEYESEIREFTSRRRDIVDQAALLWKLIYHAVYAYQQRYPKWHYVRHDELSEQPIEGFREMFDYLGLQYTQAIQATIRWHSGSAGDEEFKNNQSQYEVVRRNSQENVANWTSRLSSAEARRVRERVAPVAALLYPEEEWPL